MSVFDLSDDIMELILIELLPRQRYNQVVREYKDPRFHKGAARVLKGMDGSHPGRVYLRVIHPVFTSWPHYPMRCLRSEKREDKQQRAKWCAIRSYKHQLKSIELNKVGLCAYDNKRYLLDRRRSEWGDGIESLSYGHHRI